MEEMEPGPTTFSTQTNPNIGVKTNNKDKATSGSNTKEEIASNEKSNVYSISSQVILREGNKSSYIHG